MFLRPMAGRQRLELGTGAHSIDSIFAGESDCEKRRGASRRTADVRSSSAADEASEAIERADVAMVA